MKKKICVYTCITGTYDEIQEIEKKEENIDYYLFTNNKEIYSDTWKVVYIEDDCLDNQQLSRKIKMLGHPLIDKKYDISIWMDANINFQKSINDFVKEYYDESEAPFSAFKHHARSCIYEEANVCIQKRKDSKEKIREHIEFLKSQKYPKNNGLYEMTVFIKNHNNKSVEKTMKTWFDMVCKYSKRDQLSFMYSVWKNKMKVKTIDLNVWDNPWFFVEKHNYDEEIKKYRIYFDNGKKYNLENDIVEKYQVRDNKYIIDQEVLTNSSKIIVELSKTPCLKYKNLKVTGVEEKCIKIENSITYKNKNIFYKDESKIEVIYPFKKKEKFHLEVELEKMSKTEIYDFIDYLNRKRIADSNHIKFLSEQNNSLLLEKDRLQERIDSIEKSKGWQLLEKLRKLKGKF